MERTQELILSPEERENTPSVREGMTAEQEFEYRCFACELIRDASIMMGTFLLFVAVMCRSPVVSASGQTICHRFYYFYSFRQCHPFYSAPSLFSLTSSCDGLLLHWIENRGRAAARQTNSEGVLSDLSGANRTARNPTRGHRSRTFSRFM